MPKTLVELNSIIDWAQSAVCEGLKVLVCNLAAKAGEQVLLILSILVVECLLRKTNQYCKVLLLSPITTISCYISVICRCWIEIAANVCTIITVYSRSHIYVNRWIACCRILICLSQRSAQEWNWLNWIDAIAINLVLSSTKPNKHWCEIKFIDFTLCLAWSLLSYWYHICIR